MGKSDVMAVAAVAPQLTLEEITREVARLIAREMPRLRRAGPDELCEKECGTDFCVFVEDLAVPVGQLSESKLQSVARILCRMLRRGEAICVAALEVPQGVQQACLVEAEGLPLRGMAHFNGRRTYIMRMDVRYG